jgi:hypothetical protein
MGEEPQTRRGQHRGLEAFQIAMSDPTIPIYRLTWRGNLQPLSRSAAAELCARGAHEVLWCARDDRS